MVKIMENPIKMDDFGGTTIFGNIHLLVFCRFFTCGCCMTEDVMFLWKDVDKKIYGNAFSHNHGDPWKIGVSPM